jgi:hypothetical protein
MIANHKKVREQCTLLTDVVILSTGPTLMVEPEHLSDELVPKIFSILMTFPHPIISWTTAMTLNAHKMEYRVAASHIAREVHEKTAYTCDWEQNVSIAAIT